MIAMKPGRKYRGEPQAFVRQIIEDRIGIAQG
jgi:hypothetical protein